MAFPMWPYSNLHDLNLDWILSKVKTIDENVADSKRYAEAAEESATDSENAKTDAETAKADAISAKNDAVSARNAAAISATAAQTALNNIGTATAGAVADWLAAHVDPDTGYVIDDTLTIEQAAADARAVGINVKGLLSFWVYNTESWDWEQGDISSVNGATVTSTTAIRSAVITNPSNMAVFIVGLERTGIGDQRFYTAVYDNNDTFQYKTGPYTSEFYGCMINKGWKLRVVVEYDSGSTITPADAPYGFECITLDYTDTDIQAAPGWGQAGKAADAAAVCSELYTLSQAIPGIDNTLSLSGNWAAGAAATGEAIDDIRARTHNLLNIRDAVATNEYSSVAVLSRDSLNVTSVTNGTNRGGRIELSLKPNTTYTFSGMKTTTTGSGVVGYRESSDGITWPSAMNATFITASNSDDTLYTKSFTTTTGYIRIYFYCTSSTPASGDVTFTDCQVEENEAFTYYLPYYTAVDGEARHDISRINELDSGFLGQDLFNGVDEVEGYYLNNTTGAPVANSGSAYTDIIPVTAGKKYELMYITTGNSTSAVRVMAYASNVWQSQCGYLGSAPGYNRIVFTVPNGSDGVRISFAVRRSQHVIGLVEYDSMGYASDGQARARLDNITGAVGYTAGFFGTSLMWGQNNDGNRSAFNIPAMYEKVSGVGATNNGVKGQGLIKDWSTIYGSSAKTDGYSFDGFDVVVANWSSNDSDAWRDLPLGTPTDATTSTILGHYNLLAQKWTTHYPNVAFIWLGSTGLWSTTIKGYGATLQGGGTPFTFSELMDGIKAVMAQYGIPFVDYRVNNAFNINNYQTLLGSDNVHPTDDGYNRLSAIAVAEIMARWHPIGASLNS